jgi:Flp pilus assembly pilin Flp
MVLDEREDADLRRRDAQQGGKAMYERFLITVGRAMTLDLRDLLRRQEGQTVTEYSVVLAFVAVALVALLATLNTGLKGFVAKVVTDLGNLPGGF